MAKPTVDVETSVIGYAAAEPSRDLIVAARQQLTREWWATRAHRYKLYVSQLVINEASAGNPDAAKHRIALLHDIARLAISDAADALASQLVDNGAVPRTAADDAFHIAVPAVHGVEFLATWNFRHIANASMRKAIEDTCRSGGYAPPTICTPEELTHDSGE